MNPKLRKAIRSHQAGQLTAARRGYERVLKSESENEDALHFFGVLIHQQGNSERAIRLIRKAVSINPSYASAWQNLGNVYKESGAPGEAEECYRRLVELEPASAGGFANLCVILKLRGAGSEAIEAGRRATALDPGNALCWYGLANAFKSVGRLEEAIEHYEKAISCDPAFLLAHDARCHTIYLVETRQGLAGADMQRTRKAYRQWLEADPESPVSRYMLSAFNEKEQASRAPDYYVVGLFDQFSNSFDHNLASLDYRVPELMISKVQTVFPEAAGTLQIADAGCGTGLLASGLRPWADKLIGIDLSPGMLIKARARKRYDELHEAELSGWFAGRKGLFDLVICADTLIYFGDLASVLPDMYDSLKPGGYLLFTLELHSVDGPEFRLNPHGRFSHSRDYVRKCLFRCNPVSVEVEDEVLRNEGGQPVAGLLVSVRKG